MREGSTFEMVAQHDALRSAHPGLLELVNARITHSSLALVAAIAAVAAAYFIVARLSLLLAIPPGYATAVWPASGVALAALLLYGRRLWPGVLLGSFMANAPTALSGPDAGAGALLIAFSIGAGASLQALLAARVAAPMLRRDPGLLNLGSIVGVLGLGGAVCCLVSATWGSTTLLLAGATSLESFPLNWITWWAGDVIGTVLVLPLAYIGLGAPRRFWRRRFASVALPLALTLVAVTSIFFASKSQEERRVRLEFEREAVAISEALTRKFATYFEALYSIQSFFAASESVTREEFRRFVERKLQRLPGIHALSWNPRISNEARKDFETAAREDGLSGFSVSEKAADGMVPADERAEYLFVYYIEPMDANMTALGFDVYSDPVRRAALDEARDTGEAVASGGVTLVQETGEQTGVLVFVPVYEDGVVPESVGERRLRLRGYAVGVFRVGHVLETAINSAHAHNLAVRFFAIGPDARREQLAGIHLDESNHPQELVADTPVTGFQWSQTYSMVGRTWELVITPGSSYFSVQTNWHAWTLLAGGLSLAALLGVFLLSLTGRRMLDEQRAGQLADTNQRLRDEIRCRELLEQALQAERDWAEITLHSIGDAVVSTDDAGLIEYMNPAAEKFSGWCGEDAIGNPVSSIFRFIVESTRETIDPVKMCLQQEQIVTLVDQLLLVDRAGAEYAIQDSAAPIKDHTDRVRGAVLVFNDVTESRRMVREVVHQASHDPLTELYNRREFDKRLARVVSSSTKYGSRHALCYLDLDHFKTVNDSAGHLAGDQLLKQLAKLLESQVRGRDTVARLGGDEFGILLDNCPTDKAIEIAEKIVVSVHKLNFVWEEHSYRVGVSIGLVPITNDVTTAQEATRRADVACYTAKKSGRNRFHLYDPDSTTEPQLTSTRTQPVTPDVL